MSSADCLHQLWYYYAIIGNYQCVSCGLIESPSRHQRRLLKKPEPVVERQDDGLPVRRYQKE